MFNNTLTTSSTSTATTFEVISPNDSSDDNLNYNLTINHGQDLANKTTYYSHAYFLARTYPFVYGLVGVPLNAANIILICRRWLVTSHIVYVSLLSVVDIVALVHIFINANFHYLRLAVTPGFCQYIQFIIQLSSQLSCWILVLLTFERAVVIRYPFYRVTVLRSKHSVILVAILSLLLSAIHVHLLFTVTSSDDGNCTYRPELFHDIQLYWYNAMTGMFVLASVILIGSNIVIVTSLCYRKGDLQSDRGRGRGNGYHNNESSTSIIHYSATSDNHDEDDQSTLTPPNSPKMIIFDEHIHAAIGSECCRPIQNERASEWSRKRQFNFSTTKTTRFCGLIVNDRYATHITGSTGIHWETKDLDISSTAQRRQQINSSRSHNNIPSTSSIELIGNLRTGKLIRTITYPMQRRKSLRSHLKSGGDQDHRNITTTCKRKAGYSYNDTKMSLPYPGFRSSLNTEGGNSQNDGFLNIKNNTKTIHVRNEKPRSGIKHLKPGMRFRNALTSNNKSKYSFKNPNYLFDEHFPANEDPSDKNNGRSFKSKTAPRYVFRIKEKNNRCDLQKRLPSSPSSSFLSSSSCRTAGDYKDHKTQKRRLTDDTNRRRHCDTSAFKFQFNKTTMSVLCASLAFLVLTFPFHTFVFLCQFHACNYPLLATVLFVLRDLNHVANVFIYSWKTINIRWSQAVNILCKNATRRIRGFDS